MIEQFVCLFQGSVRLKEWLLPDGRPFSIQEKFIRNILELEKSNKIWKTHRFHSFKLCTLAENWAVEVIHFDFESISKKIMDSLMNLWTVLKLCLFILCTYFENALSMLSEREMICLFKMVLSWNFFIFSCLSVWIKFQKIFTTKWVSIENSVFETDFILYISAKKRRPFSHTYEMVEQLLLLLFFSNSTTLKLPPSQQLWSRVENQLVQMFFEIGFVSNIHALAFSLDVVCKVHLSRFL